MKNIIKISVCLLLSSTVAKGQQEPQYSQNQFNSNLMINPAYAGAASCPSIGFRYRKQWTGLDGSPTTFSFIGETKVLSDRLGIGLCANSDVLGIDRTFNVDANIAYHLPINDKGKLAFGFKAGAAWMKSDFSKLSGITPGDPLYGSTQKYTTPYIGFGALYYTDRFYVGASAPRMVSFEQSSARSKIIAQHYYLYGGLKITLDENLELRPALLTKYQSKAPIEFDLATDIWYQNTFGVGVAYRTGDAINFMVKMKYQKIFLGYSYDMNISKLRTFNNGSHEIFVGFEFCRKQNMQDPTRNNSVRYF